MAGYTSYSLRDCSHIFPPSRSICSFLDLQPNFLHTLFHLLPPCHFWPSSLSLPIHFQHHCLLQFIIIILSDHMAIPSYSIRLCHSIQRFLQPNISISSFIFFLSTNFTPHIDLTMALSVLLKIAISLSLKHHASLPYSIADLTQLR